MKRVLIAAVTGLTVTACERPYDGKITLTWNNTSGGETSVERKARDLPVTFYREVDVVGPGLATYEDRAVSAGTEYCYRLRTKTGELYSPYTGEICGVAKPKTANP